MLRWEFVVILIDFDGTSVRYPSELESKVFLDLEIEDLNLKIPKINYHNKKPHWNPQTKEHTAKLYFSFVTSLVLVYA